MGEGGVPRVQECILVKNAPHFWALALTFVVQVPTSLSTPLEGGGAREARRAERGGRLAFNAFLALTKWPFSTKMIFSKRSKIHDIKY